MFVVVDNIAPPTCRLEIKVIIATWVFTASVLFMIFGQRTACSLPWQRIQIPIYFHNRIQNCWESTGHKLRKLSDSLWPSWICIWQRVDWMSNTNKHQLVTFLHRQLSSLHIAYCTIPTTSPISWPWVLIPLQSPIVSLWRSLNRRHYVSGGNYGSLDDSMVIASMYEKNVGSEASDGSPRCEKGKFLPNHIY